MTTKLLEAWAVLAAIGYAFFFCLAFSGCAPMHHYVYLAPGDCVTVETENSKQKICEMTAGQSMEINK